VSVDHGVLGYDAVCVALLLNTAIHTIHTIHTHEINPEIPKYVPQNYHETSLQISYVYCLSEEFRLSSCDVLQPSK
jgi:hypothetical protein